MHLKASSVATRSESVRLKSLRSYNILDTVSESEYDSITRIAAGICNVPVSLMTLIDEKRQWFKSNFGFDIKEVPREMAFCNHLVNDPSQVLVVPDLREDYRFSQNPLVAGQPNVVFYAGAPLINSQGHVLGSICVYDQKTNDLDENQKEALAALASQVMNSLELRKKIRELKEVQSKLRRVNQNLKKFAHIISHDIKTPLASISMLTTAVQSSYDAASQESNKKLLALIHKNARVLQDFIDQVLVQSGRSRKSSAGLTDPNKLIADIVNLVATSKDVEVKIAGKLPSLPIAKASLQQIIQNLITNAIKYNDKETVVINISSETCDRFHNLLVTDNGTGIAKPNLADIFKEGQTLGKTDRFGNSGTGIGLHTVKRLLKSMGGDISVTSKVQEGSVFTISIPKHISKPEWKDIG